MSEKEEPSTKNASGEEVSLAAIDCCQIEDIEARLMSDLECDFADLKALKDDHEKIGNPDTIGETVLTVVWDQVVNQIGQVAGEDFIKENRGLRLDLRKDAHIQTTGNFSNGKIATHNTEIDYQQRYDDWQSNFQKDENGNVVTHKTRSGRQEATLVKGAREKLDDAGRPRGSKERGTDMDHVISAGEQIRDPAANAHLTKEERVEFANSDKNLQEIPANLNRSKKDKPTKEWLENPNAKGQKPEEIFDNLTEEKKKELLKKEAEARKEFEKRKKEGEQRSIETGKKSRRQEAFRISGMALRGVLMGLLAEFVKGIIQKFVSWLRQKKKDLNSFIEQLTAAVKSFFSDIKQKCLTAGNTLLTTAATAVYGPIVNTLKKAWIFLKQGAKSLKEAFDYIRNPANSDKPVSVVLLEVGKIVMSGIAAAGAIALGEVIEKGLMAFPVFAVTIPFFGSLASILGIFFGALISGLIGALALNLMDRAISGILERKNRSKQIGQMNKILGRQHSVIAVKTMKATQTQNAVAESIADRHTMAVDAISQSLQTIYKETDCNVVDNNDILSKVKTDLDDLLK